MDVIEDGNKQLLEDPERYLLYIIQESEKIIKDYSIKYNDIQDNRKTYPKFTTKQFIFILQLLNKRVYQTNIILIKHDIYKYRYDISKVEKAYNIFKLYCNYYNMNYNINLFTIFCGVEKTDLINWLNTGKSRLYISIMDDSKSINEIDFANSNNALLRLHYVNNTQPERIEAGVVDTLPDLLPVSDQKALPEPPQN